jgi:arylsulfatase A-like enzyme
MLMRVFGLSAVVLFVFAVLSGCQPDPAPSKNVKKEKVSKPAVPFKKYRDHNIVFVSFDALQAGHVGFLGYDRDVAPNLDAFAEKSHSFSRACSVASWTVPASMTWFTGVFPSEHRMTNKFAVWNDEEQKLANLRELSPGLLTLADILKANGYVTGGFTGNAGVSGGFGYEQGFDVYYYPKNTFGKMEGSIPRALEWLKKNRKKKFFLFLHGYDVHGQSTPTDGFDYRYVDKNYDYKFTGAELEQEVLREEGLENGQLTLRDEDVQFWRDVYDEKINRTDKRFGQFLKEFDKLGLGDKTLFVLTSDHGTELYEHRRFDHGFTLYDELIHVPLIVRLPGQTKGRVISDRVSSIDVMPTILDLLDVRMSDKATEQLRGKSLVPALNGQPVKRDVISETNYRDYTFKRSIITPDGWKLIYTLETKSRELYNLNDDPGEKNDLAKVRHKIADELQKKLFTHFKRIGHDLTKRDWKVGLNPVYRSQGKPKPEK